ncbi:hypothetical protein MOMA_01225 [Moraxella macacae 0408225]|uniref:Histidine kinase BarA N-terminal domain-containing protein n=1 Tax=Moraxella macacae 0408225 TaxID=1230338 RepID=L2F934_9GAMM|nr:hypothetical protein [Moraxella macacae]ELA08988.1 hypothetical protein MOMA_01225 [Moraxella macacae 0408225]
MSHLAPRQGIFAIVLLVSFCLHLLVIMLSVEKQRYDYQTDKGEKIVEQLSKEALVAIGNQDRISLSVLANRYQVDSDIAKLIITDNNQQTLVQTGQSQNDVGQVIDKLVIQDNQQIGHVSVTMKALSNGEILGQQWLFMLGSAVLHLFLWLIYGYVARPTQDQMDELGEKVQQRLAMARQGGNFRQNVTNETLAQQQNSEQKVDTKLNENPKTTIQQYLQKNRQANPSVSSMPVEQDQSMPNDDNVHNNNVHNDNINKDNINKDNINKDNATVQAPNDTPKTYDTPNSNQQQTLAIQIRFFDEFQLLERLTPDTAKPYLHLCEQLLLRACDSLLSPNSSMLNQYSKGVELKELPHFDKHGAVLHLTGQADKVALTAVLLSKLVLILNQVVYEKHRELSRFALPMLAGVGMAQQFDDVHRLMNNHGKDDSLLILYPQFMLKTLEQQIQMKQQIHPRTVKEREMRWYSGLSQSFMKELIQKRDDILTSAERYQAERYQINNQE